MFYYAKEFIQTSLRSFRLSSKSDGGKWVAKNSSQCELIMVNLMVAFKMFSFKILIWVLLNLNYKLKNKWARKQLYKIKSHHTSKNRWFEVYKNIQGWQYSMKFVAWVDEKHLYISDIKDWTDWTQKKI